MSDGYKADVRTDVIAESCNPRSRPSLQVNNKGKNIAISRKIKGVDCTFYLRAFTGAYWRLFLTTVVFKSIRPGGTGDMVAEILSSATSCGTRDTCQNFGHHVGRLRRAGHSGAMEPPTSTAGVPGTGDKHPISAAATRLGTGDGRIDLNTTVPQ
jgi:hypothetical protein